jgi:hypothetical protein
MRWSPNQTSLDMLYTPDNTIISKFQFQSETQNMDMKKNSWSDKGRRRAWIQQLEGRDGRDGSGVSGQRRRPLAIRC